MTDTMLIIVCFLLGFISILLAIWVNALCSKVDELKREVDSNNKISLQNNALLNYRINSLLSEIDFHLHNKSDELAVSYFANCREYRDEKGTSQSKLFDVWKGK